MGNPIMGMMANKVMANNPRFQQLAEFRKFMESMKGRDPQKIIQDMLNSGKIDQTQLEQAKAMAAQFRNQIK